MVTHDCQGLVLASMSEQILLSQSVVEVEAIATVKAIHFVQELSHPLVIFEGDFEIIIKALCSEDDSLSSYGHLIAEAKVCSDSFLSCCFSHIHK